MPPTNPNNADYVTENDRATTFYRDYKGQPVAREGSFGAELLTAPPHIGIHPAQHPTAQALVGRETGLTFHVPDLLQYCERLHEHGVRFVNEPTKQPFGIMALIADPDGNVLALWEEEREG
jgi:predicted enzyme related to lactoylglutathione lyase